MASASNNSRSIALRNFGLNSNTPISSGQSRLHRAAASSREWVDTARMPFMSRARNRVGIAPLDEIGGEAEAPVVEAYDPLMLLGSVRPRRPRLAYTEEAEDGVVRSRLTSLPAEDGDDDDVYAEHDERAEYAEGSSRSTGGRHHPTHEPLSYVLVRNPDGSLGGVINLKEEL